MGYRGSPQREVSKNLCYCTGKRDLCGGGCWLVTRVGRVEGGGVEKSERLGG